MKLRTGMFLAVIMYSQLLCGANCKYRLIYNSSQINQSITDDTLQIKNIHLAFMSGLLVVKLKNKARLIFRPGEVWGYQDPDGIYRYYGKQLYRLEQCGQLMIYSQQTGYKLFDKDYYFSKTGDSPVVDMSKKNLKAEFSKNECFMEKLDRFFDKKHIYFSIDDSESCTIITELYRECKAG